jgi:hypothetical protein
MRLACDTGGTFTDLLVEADGCLRMYKSSTTPDDPTLGVLDAGVAEIGSPPPQLGATAHLPRSHQLEHAIDHRHHHVVHPMPVPAGRGTQRHSVTRTRSLSINTVGTALPAIVRPLPGFPPAPALARARIPTVPWTRRK